MQFTIVVENEPMKHYAKGSEERAKLEEAINEMLAKLPYDVPCVVNGKEVLNDFNK